MNFDPQSIRPYNAVSGPSVYLPKDEYRRLMMRNRPKSFKDIDRQVRRVSLSKISAAKSTSPKQRKYFGLIADYQTGFKKAAEELGFDRELTEAMLKEALQYEDPEKKKPDNFARNMGLGLAGATALGASAYGLSRPGAIDSIKAKLPFLGTGNSLPKPDAVAPADPEISKLINDRMSARRNNWLENSRPDLMDQIRTPATLADEGADLGGKAMLGGNVARLGAAIPGVKNIPGLQTVAKGAGRMTPGVGAGLSIYNQFKDTSLPEYYMGMAGVDAAKNPGATKAIQGLAGSADAASWFHPVGMVGNMAVRMPVDIASDVADKFQGVSSANSEGYRGEMASFIKMIKSQNPQEKQMGLQAAKQFLDEHNPGMDKLINPSTWERLKLNSFNLGPQSFASDPRSVVNNVNTLMSQLKRVDTPEAVGGDASLGRWRDLLTRKMQENSSSLANH